MIDSHGKPGIAGNAIGVETETVVEVLVVGVLTTVSVDTEELTTVVVSEFVVVTEIVDAELDELVVVAL
jgi:hypothetical protein